MKTITGLLFLFTAIFLTSCEGPVGPEGPQGLPGADGQALLGSVFETDPINFAPANDYSYLFQFPTNFEIYDGDLVLVYILWEQTSTNDGGTVDVWRLLPQTVVLDDGVLQYNFDHTTADVKIFLEGTTDFNNLLPAETDNQIFRIAVIPAAFAKNNNIDVTDFNAVMKSMNLNLNSIKKINSSVDISKK
jgi:hypothetical protein